MSGALRASFRTLRVFLYLWYGIWLTLRYGSWDGLDQRLHAARRRWYRRALQWSGVEIESTGRLVDGPALVVANHVSWLDIPVLGTSSDVRFLSKSEIARWPLIGWLARRNGTLFIRRGAHESETIIRDITAALRAGQQVAIFPEATTTRGDEVRHFHARLFAAAIESGAPVQPVAFDYGREPDGSPPAASYSGGDRLVPHAWRLLSRENTAVRLHILPPLPVTPGMTRRELARQAHRAVCAALALPDRNGAEAANNDGAE